jgi:hypothetical protein
MRSFPNARLWRRHAGTVAPGWIEVEWGVVWDRYADSSRGAAAPSSRRSGSVEASSMCLTLPCVRPASLDAAGDLAVGVKWRFTDGAPVLGRFAILPV